METFAELLSKYIKQAGISDAELSRAIGVSRQTIFRWRAGLTSRPNSREDVLAISKKLRLSPEEQDKLLLSAGFRPDEANAVKPPGSPSTVEPPTISETPEQNKVVETEQPDVPSISRPGVEIIIKPGKKSDLFYIILTSGVLLVIAVALVMALNWSHWFSSQGQENSPVSPTVSSISGTNPIAPAGPGETLILVAPLDESASGSGVGGQLLISLQRESKKQPPFEHQDRNAAGEN